MDTLPISTLPTPPAPAGAENAVDAADPANAMPDGDFHALLCRSLAGLAQGTKGTGAAEPGAPGEETAATVDGTAAAVPEGVLNASESALALLAALPQQAARPESAPPGGGGIGGGTGGSAGIENTTRTGACADEPGTPGTRLARPGDTGPLRAVEPENAGAITSRSSELVADLNVAGTQQSAHYAAASPLVVDAAPASTMPGTPSRIETPLAAPGWSTALAEQLVVFANEKRQVAELRINPPHLGPVEITLTVGEDRTSAVFASPHAIVRETIESALPRLREVLAESGITLGQATVTADSPRDGSAQAQSRSSFPPGGDRSGSDAAHAAAASQTASRRRSIGLVDLFA